MKRLPLFLAILAGALFLWGCQKDAITAPEPEPEPEPAQSDPAYLEMLAYLREGRWFSAVGYRTGETTVVFSGGASVKVSSFSISSIEPRITTSNGYWVVNGAVSGLKVRSGGTLDDCVPLAGLRENDKLTLFLDNGTLLYFVRSEEYLFQDLRFTAEANKGLDADVDATRDGLSWHATLPEEVDVKSVVADFLCCGKSVTVAGRKQVSGETEVDFTERVDYVVEGYDGKFYTFPVTLEVSGQSSERVREGTVPRVYLTTSSAITSKETYVNGKIRFYDPDGWYSDEVEVEQEMRIRGRGQTSWGKPKKPYRIKLGEKTKVFGMKGNKDWDLIANYCDKSLLRNKLGMAVSAALDMSWTPDHRTCDVYLNGVYQGCYDLFQHKEIAGEKVDINPVLPGADPDSGDYYLEIESNDHDFRTSNPGGATNFMIPVIYKDPEYDELSDAQRNFIKDWLLDMEKCFGRSDYTTTTGYRKYLDAESFARFYIVEEIAKNIDGNLRKSTFMTKTAGNPLVLYHIWDFDIAFGNCNYMHSEFRPASNGIYGHDPEGFFVKVVDEHGTGNGLMQNLFKDPYFVSEVKRLWDEAYPELSTLGEFIRDEAAVYSASYRSDFNKWSNPKSDNWPEPSPIAYTYDAALEKLVSFYEKRIAWLNTEIRKL